MRLGLHALGIGSGSQRAVIEAVARAAEQHTFATLWSGEHVVMVDESASRYPYADDGKIAVPAVADWIDPMVACRSRPQRPPRSGSPPGCCCCPNTTR